MQSGLLRWKPLVSLIFLLLLTVFASLFFPGSGSADPAKQWASLVTGADGSGNPIYTWIYGYYVNVESGTSNVFIQCDTATGKETGSAYIAGQQVGTGNEQVPQVSYQLDPIKMHTLYAAENFPNVLWKGDTHLLHYWAAGNMLHATSPYPTLPASWRMMVFQFMNDNPWPVVANMAVSLGAGESYYGNEPFNANETKYLMLQLNSNLQGQNVANNFWTWASIHQNLDPLAPPMPPAAKNFITDPAADDNTGTTRSASEWEGLSFQQQGSHWSTGSLWGLQPGFKQVPRWVSNPGEDSHWGHIEWDSVPAYLWVKIPGYDMTAGSGNGAIDVHVAGLPYIVPGSLGSSQSTPPSGPYTTGTSNGQTVYQPIYGSYEKVVAASLSYRSENHGSYCYYQVDSSTVETHCVFYNPSDYPVSVTVSGGYAYQYPVNYQINMPSLGSIAIQPHQYATLIGSYSLPQGYWDWVWDDYNQQYDYNFFPTSDTVPPEWSSRDSGIIGTCRPVTRLWNWTGSGFKSNAVAYDQGLYQANYQGESNVYSVSNSPGFDGSLIDYESIMTSQELTQFQVGSDVRSKVNDVLANGATTWNINNSYYYRKDNGYLSSLTLR